MIRELAEATVFNNPLLTPMVSAFNTELYEACTYLSVRKDEATERNKQIEEENRRRKANKR